MFYLPGCVATCNLQLATAFGMTHMYCLPEMATQQSKDLSRLAYLVIEDDLPAHTCHELKCFQVVAGQAWTP
jgi:hypothetical protein